MYNDHNNFTIVIYKEILNLICPKATHSKQGNEMKTFNLKKLLCSVGFLYIWMFCALFSRSINLGELFCDNTKTSVQICTNSERIISHGDTCVDSTQLKVMILTLHVAITIYPPSHAVGY